MIINPPTNQINKTEPIFFLLYNHHRHHHFGNGRQFFFCSLIYIWRYFIYIDRYILLLLPCYSIFFSYFHHHSKFKQIMEEKKEREKDKILINDFLIMVTTNVMWNQIKLNKIGVNFHCILINQWETIHFRIRKRVSKQERKRKTLFLANNRHWWF